MIPSGIFGGWAERMPGRVPDFNGDGRDDVRVQEVHPLQRRSQPILAITCIGSSSPVQA